jgi:GNAT superfamily N-acetyltransferase
MQAIERAVNIARVRLNANLFLQLAFRALLVGLGFAALAWSIPKIWPLENWLPGVTATSWCWGSLIGGITLGMVYSIFNLWRRSTSQLDAAVEVDRRFGLKERLSSALALDEQAAGSSVGQALIADAEGRAARIDVRDQFPIRLDRRLAWLLAPIAAIIALGFVPNARTPEKVPVTPVVNESKPIEVAVEVAKKSLEERAKQLEEQGLKEAAAELQTLAKKFDSLPAGESDLKKDALLKLNDVRDELDKQRSA